MTRRSRFVEIGPGILLRPATPVAGRQTGLAPEGVVEIRLCLKATIEHDRRHGAVGLLQEFHGLADPPSVDFLRNVAASLPVDRLGDLAPGNADTSGQPFQRQVRIAIKPAFAKHPFCCCQNLLIVGMRLILRSWFASAFIRGEILGFRKAARDRERCPCDQGYPCLLCGGYVDPRRAREEAIRRDDPDAYARLKEEAYVLGEGDPSPAVVTFTTEAAAMAVNEWLAGVTGLAGAAGMVPTRMRRFHSRDERRPLVEVRSGCPCCDVAQTLGRGDVQPFLDMVT